MADDQNQNQNQLPVNPDRWPAAENCLPVTRESGISAVHAALIKKKIKFSSYIREFRMEQLLSHIWLMAFSYMGKYLRISSYSILGSPSSYMTLQLLHSEMPYIWGKFDFLFYQCGWPQNWEIITLKVVTNEKGETVGEVLTIIC